MAKDNCYLQNINQKTDVDIADISSSDVKSDIFIHLNTDGTDSGFNELINLMSENGLAFYNKKSNGGLIAKDDVVILKINAQWDQRGGTNVDLVRAAFSLNQNYILIIL